MSPLPIALLGIAVIGVLVLPRRWAALPLLIGGCYLPAGLSIDVGPFSFYALRLLLAVAVVRIVIRGEHLSNGMHKLDWMMLWWAAAAVISSLFHEPVSGTLVNRLGLVYTACGTYFVLRVFCESRSDVIALCRITAIALIPIAFVMLVEKLTGHNYFSEFAGLSANSEIRNGTIRAKGPFAHPILAGSVGAVSLPLMVALWTSHWKTGFFGIVACLAMVFTSGSSGPVMSVAFSIGALLMWYWHRQMRFMRWAAIFGYIALDIVMNAPAYYVLTRIDFTGSSTSWHRAALIETALAHLSEWWLAGTTYTRHWLPYGVPWSGNHIDITNYYLRMGVDGGLPLMLTFIAVLARGFGQVGRLVNQTDSTLDRPFVIWVLGASLFSHAATFVSISYFDQSVAFLYVTLAAIGSSVIRETSLTAEAEASSQRRVRIEIPTRLGTR